MMPENVKKIAKVLLEEIDKYYPGLSKKVYDSLGIPTDVGLPAQIRAEMCIYIELMKSGAFNCECENGKIPVDPLGYKNCEKCNGSGYFTC